MKKDYYEILGVKKDTAISDIKKSYRKLALSHHPDRVPEEKKKQAEEEFKEISEAYAVLSDNKKRQMYDQYGHSGIDQNYTTDDIFRGTDFGGFEDILSQFFGGGGGGFDIFGGGSRSRRPQRGRSLQIEVDLILEEAFQGVKKNIRVPRHDLCQACQGSGAKPGTKPKTCQRCQGRGQTVQAINTPFGQMQNRSTCPECQGEGKVIAEFCSVCHGQGIIRVTRKVEVKFPAGVHTGSQLRLQGEGEVGKAGRGDLYIFVRVKEHKMFQRDGNDIYMNLSVSFVKAALGAEMSVPTLGGKVTMKIPAGTQSGKMFRLKSKGMSDLRGYGNGNQYIRVMLEVPTKLTAEQRRLLEEYAQISGESINQKNGSFSEKLKKVFK